MKDGVSMIGCVLTLRTARLELVAGTAGIVRAEIGDRAEFAQLLAARVPEGWPPPLNDEESMWWAVRFSDEHPDAAGWSKWYFVVRGPERQVIGNGGFKGLPDADGTAEVGYAILPEHQRRGYATEAVAALVGWAFGWPTVVRVVAETFPPLAASIRVLEKNGFRYIGPGSEDGTIRYERMRA
jgi:[ribosomal protein S5]-alanine N-acetyltransferase